MKLTRDEKAQAALYVVLSPLILSIALGLLYAVLLFFFMIWRVPYEVLRDCL